MTDSEQSNDLWRGVGLSGITLVLGVGAGRLVELLAQEALQAGGLVVLASYARSALDTCAELSARLPIERLCARPRHLPLADASVDLCVINGSLRETPVARYRTLLEELWRVLVPGGHLRVADLIAPSGEPTGATWARRSAMIAELGQALGRPVALHADVRALAEAMREVGYESMAVSLLPGYALTDEWLSDTIEAIRAMSSRVADPEIRRKLLDRDLRALIASYRAGDQRAAERFAMRGNKVGNLALDMETAGTEEVLAARDEAPFDLDVQP
jgi:SAM-dependent methyltransferase